MAHMEAGDLVTFAGGQPAYFLALTVEIPCRSLHGYNGFAFRDRGAAGEDGQQHAKHSRTRYSTHEHVPGTIQRNNRHESN
jgi:hypothetical protein